MVAFTKKIEYDITPGLGSQKVVTARLKVAAAGGEANCQIPIPFKGYLASVQVCATDAMSLTDVMIQKTHINGTALYKVTLAESATVGTTATGTVQPTGVSQADLVIDNDYLNAEISSTSAGTAVGSFMLYLIFETADALVI